MSGNSDSQRFFCRGEDDACGGLDDTLPRLNFRKQLLKASRVLRPDFQHVGPVARNRMTFQYFFGIIKVIDKRGKMFRRVDRDRNERGDVFSQPLVVKFCEVAGDNPGFFQFPQPLADGGKGKSDAFSKIVSPGTSLFLKNLKDLCIDVIQHIQEFS